MNTRYRCFIVLALFTAFFTLSGCGTFHLGVKQEEINTDRYVNAKEFLKNQNLGTSKTVLEDDLLLILKDSGEQQLIQVNKAEDIQKILLGGMTPQGHKEDLVDISKWILSHHTFSLPYKNVRTEFAFDWLPISYNFWEFGPDMSIIFITQKNDELHASPYVLVRTIVDGTENAKKKNKEYIWQGLGTAIIGAAKKLIF
jgi:hypothetical protein